MKLNVVNLKSYKLTPETMTFLNIISDPSKWKKFINSIVLPAFNAL